MSVAPADVALGFMNNLAYVQGMRPVYQLGAFAGTVGEYDHRALSLETSPHRDKLGGGAPFLETPSGF